MVTKNNIHRRNDICTIILTRGVLESHLTHFLNWLKIIENYERKLSNIM